MNQGPMSSRENISKKAKIDHRFYLMQEIEAYQFLELNEEG